MIVQSKEVNSKNGTGQTNLKSAFFNFLPDGREINLKSNESLDVMENLAKREYLDGGSKITEISLKTPFIFLDVGDVVKINSPSYNIPETTGKDKFIVVRVSLEIEFKSAYLSITARRWD